jgi:hypothetical protein
MGPSLPARLDSLLPHRTLPWSAKTRRRWAAFFPNPATIADWFIPLNRPTVFKPPNLRPPMLPSPRRGGASRTLFSLRSRRRYSVGIS